MGRVCNERDGDFLFSEVIITRVGGSKVVLDIPHTLVLRIQHGVELIEDSLQWSASHIGQNI